MQVILKEDNLTIEEDLLNIKEELSIEREKLLNLLNRTSRLSKQEKKIVEDAYWHIVTAEDLLKEVEL